MNTSRPNTGSRKTVEPEPMRFSFIRRPIEKQSGGEETIPWLWEMPLSSFPPLGREI